MKQESLPKEELSVPEPLQTKHSSVEDFLSAQDEKEIVEAIRVAEKNTSGEIRVHLEKKITGDIEQYAKKIFHKLNMHRTRSRNAVLFVIGVESRNFAIYGDKSIHQKTGNNFWNSVKEEMQTSFKSRQFKEGLVQAILQSGTKLKTYFPYQSDDKNELPDEISKGE